MWLLAAGAYVAVFAHSVFAPAPPQTTSREVHPFCEPSSGVADIPSARQGFARGFGRPGVAEGFFGVRPPGAAAGQHCGGGTNPPVGVALVVIVSQCQTGCKQHHERVLTELSIKF